MKHSLLLHKRSSIFNIQNGLKTLPSPVVCVQTRSLQQHKGYFFASLEFVNNTARKRIFLGLMEAPQVQIDTTVGTFCVELYKKHTPNTCKNFLELSKKGYYDGTLFHRIIHGFVVQGGDPTGTGRGGESIYGDKFEDEITRELKHTGAGVISMANAGPNTNGSQFFITLAPCPSLDGKHSVFGRVCSGMQVVKRLGNVQTDNNDRPKTDVKILRARPV